MLTSETLHYPYDINQEDDGRFCAKLVDLPDGPYGWGYNAQSALKQLVQVAIPVLNEHRLGGRPIHPTTATEKETIMVGPVLALTPTRPSPNSDIRKSRDSLVYGWTDGATSGKK
ncbi:MAG: hypothetical protein KDE14_11475 [Rhodobacteraceae bacterium]|nr:hypothetical protein [Paracoccaceae bacterium]